MRKVYLDKVDIGESTSLELNFFDNNLNSYLLYFLSYGCIADQVIMQGSAPLKSSIIQRIFHILTDAFIRDEKHNTNNPIFSFSLGNEDEGYFDYNKKRRSKLKGAKQNSELEAYNKSDSLNHALKLDQKLKFVGVSKKEYSVGKIFKNAVIVDIKNLKFLDNEKGDNFKEQAIWIANEMEVFQSFEYLKRFKLNKIKKAAFYKLIRNNYYAANAKANNALSTINSIHFYWSNIYKLIDALDIKKLLYKAPKAIVLFYLRESEPLSSVKNLYFKCQNNQEISVLIETIKWVKKHGKYYHILRNGPQATIAFVFSQIASNDGFKPISQAGKALSESFVKDKIKIHNMEQIHRLITTIKKLEIELKLIENKL